MKYSVCVDSVFRGYDFQDALKKCHEIGADAIEFWSWWDKDLDRGADYMQENNMTVTAFCPKFISLVDAEKRPAFLQSIQDGIRVAQKLSCHQLILQTGNDTGEPRDKQISNLVCTLQECVPLLAEHHVTLLLEPLNTKVDHIGYFINSSDEMAMILDRVGSDNVKMLFDIYHQQISEGDLLRHITEHISKIRHVHAAGNPGRNEIFYSEINYPYIFAELDRLGYEGYVGLEFFAKDDPVKSLKRILTSVPACL